MLHLLKMVQADPLNDIQLLEIRKLLTVPVLRTFFATQMYQEILNRFAQNLDVANPLSFVQSEAYYKGRAEMFEWLLNYSDSTIVTTDSGTNQDSSTTR